MGARSVQLEWRVIREFPDYQITLTGLIRKTKTGVMHSTQFGQYGETVMLSKRGKRYHRTVNSLVRETFRGIKRAD